MTMDNRVQGGQKLCIFILTNIPIVTPWRLFSQWQAEQETFVFICMGSLRVWLKEIIVIVPFSQFCLNVTDLRSLSCLEE